MTELEERIEELEYFLYSDYEIEYHLNKWHKPSEVAEIYKKAHEEYNELLKQQAELEDNQE